ncbi:Gfo/Idh/MocA family protein [Paenibacillus spongiae]|uniref:Gfo/Idh/MocA family oxidoreductase n=1 Tax=Paenibacillus spongiae TaxID=2909671 RepID=A0ABY5SEE3_9BACL|nr:Gfo/Idh/MocA family oxidoreductase [Paenibacillus spongiae]UVI32149.1 Gfo/Idh/MocA family oxidoreductase [Paenibacillus spongiae]
MRVGIAGLDSFFFSQMYTGALQSIPGIEVAGCTTLGVSEDEIVNNAGLTSAEFGAKFNIPVYSQLEELLEKEKIDAVCITTRPTAIPGIMKKLAESGIHVFASKPVAVHAEGLQVLESIAKSSSTVVSAGLTARFEPAFIQARERVRNGDIGAPTAIRVLHQHGMLKFWPAKSWYYEEAEGGIEHFLAWYCLDLLRWFSDQEIVQIYGFAGKTVDHESPHADVLKAVCRMSSGTLGSFDVLFNVSYPYPSNEIEIIGTHGAIRVQQDQADGQVFTKDGRQSFGRTNPDTLTGELAAWAAACRGESQRCIDLPAIVQLVKSSLSLREHLSSQR